jgi:hypothetical protein
VPRQSESQTLFRGNLAGSAAVHGSDGQADDRVTQESTAKVSQDILDVAEFRAHDLVVQRQCGCFFG